MHGTTLEEKLQACRAGLSELDAARVEGVLVGVSGLAVEVAGLTGVASVGDRIALATRGGGDILAEIVGFRGGLAQALPFAAADGLGPGGKAVVLGRGGSLVVAPTDQWTVALSHDATESPA